MEHKLGCRTAAWLEHSPDCGIQAWLDSRIASLIVTHWPEWNTKRCLWKGSLNWNTCLIMEHWSQWNTILIMESKSGFVVSIIQCSAGGRVHRDSILLSLGLLRIWSKPKAGIMRGGVGGFFGLIWIILFIYLFNDKKHYYYYYFLFFLAMVMLAFDFYFNSKINNYRFYLLFSK